jgi:hypothetical protein
VLISLYKFLPNCQVLVSHSQSSNFQRINLFLPFCLYAFSPQNILIPVLYTMSRHNSVAIAVGYGLDGRGSISDRGKRFLSSPQRPDRLWDPPSLLSNCSLGGKAPGIWSYHSPSSSVEVKNGAAILPLPDMSSWRDAWLIKHRDNFTLPLHLREMFLQRHYFRTFSSNLSPLDQPYRPPPVYLISLNVIFYRING